MNKKDIIQDKLVNIHHTFLLGKITGDLFHEVNNLIGASIGFAQLARMSMEEEDVNKLIDVVLNSTEKIKEVSKSAQTYLSSSSSNGSLVDISDVVNDCITLSRKSLIKKGMKMSECANKLIAFQTDVRTLKHAILSFISSIVDNNKGGGLLEIKPYKINETQVKIEFSGDNLLTDKIGQLMNNLDDLELSENIDDDGFMAIYLIKNYLGASLEISPSSISFIINEVIS